MSKRIIWAAAVMAVVALGWQVALQAQATAVKAGVLPPFKVRADSMQLDTKSSPAHLVYSGRVSFTSTMNDLDITCDRIEANFGSVDKVTAVTATGNVLITMVSKPGTGASADANTAYNFTGKAAKVQYGLEDVSQAGAAAKRERMVRLMKNKPDDPQPTLHIVMTNLTTKATDQTDLKGDVITYNLDSGVLNAEGVTTENTGSGQ